ncbi:MAG TPA: TetR/AcrR family transcriptional regulator [Candidatus Limnocylindrales bacterium]|nr:TetR/AcrR family transcriptional regulator [Candidatus Limnocylindrales bacterium]
MGRKLEFNYERAIERATGVFWAKGYSASSMRDLLKAMGIGEGSFYHLFGSKNRLYLECLRHYNATVTRRRLALLEAEPSIRKGLRDFFRGLVDDLDNPKRPHVCLMARSLSSDVLDEADLASYVKSGMTMFEASLSGRLEKAKKAGELPANFQAEISAQIIFTFLQGYFRVVKVLKPREEMWRQIETLLTRLGL